MLPNNRQITEEIKICIETNENENTIAKTLWYSVETVLRGIAIAAVAAKSLQASLTLCDPIDSSPPGSSIHGISQARVLEWDAIAFSEI